MSKFTDGKKTIEITMKVWQDGQYSPSIENDFFEVGALTYDESIDAYHVGDLDYLVESALDWKYAVGDFCADEDVVSDDRRVWVDDVSMERDS